MVFADSVHPLENHSHSFRIQLYVATQKQRKKMRNWIIIKSSSLNRAISECLRFYYLWMNLLLDDEKNIKNKIFTFTLLSQLTQMDQFILRYSLIVMSMLNDKRFIANFWILY